MDSSFEKACRASCEVIARAAGVDLVFQQRRFFALCPLHAEKTASFSIDPAKNQWYCFGCNRGGGPVALYALLGGVSHREAILALSGDEKPVERRLRRPEEVWLEIAPSIAATWRKLYVLSDASDSSSIDRIRAEVRNLMELRRRYRLASAHSPYSRKISLDKLGEGLLEVSDNGVRAILFGLTGMDLWNERQTELEKENL